MEKKGLNWIWPEKPDVLSYEKTEVLNKIREPEIRNKRGLFSVQELSDFVL